MSLENALLLGDSVPIMRSRRKEWAERFRCVYLDPPFNTGRRFLEYDDADEPRRVAARSCARPSQRRPSARRTRRMFGLRDRRHRARRARRDGRRRDGPQEPRLDRDRRAQRSDRPQGAEPRPRERDGLRGVLAWRQGFAAAQSARCVRAPATTTRTARSSSNPSAPASAWSFEPLGPRRCETPRTHGRARCEARASGGEAFERELVRFAMSRTASTWCASRSRASRPSARPRASSCCARR